MTLIELVVAVLIVAVATVMAYGAYGTYRTRTQEAQAANDIVAVQTAVQQYFIDNGKYPNALSDVSAGLSALKDPWGNTYQYLNHAGASNGAFRKDKNIVPINSDYDLYSSGKDGATAPPLTAAPSRDDIVRANNGRFVGRASVYDP